MGLTLHPSTSQVTPTGFSRVSTAASIGHWPTRGTPSQPPWSRDSIGRSARPPPKAVDEAGFAVQERRDLSVIEEAVALWREEVRPPPAQILQRHGVRKGLDLVDDKGGRCGRPGEVIVELALP